MSIKEINRETHAYNVFTSKTLNLKKCKQECHCTQGLIWYSYRYERYYCKCCHKTDNEGDILMSFTEYDELIDHLKNCHDYILESFEIPELEDSYVTQIDYANQLFQKKDRERRNFNDVINSK